MLSSYERNRECQELENRPCYELPELSQPDIFTLPMYHSSIFHFSRMIVVRQVSEELPFCRRQMALSFPSIPPVLI